MNSDELMGLAERLQAYNRWRRDDCDDGPPPIRPHQIGLDIDAAIKVIRAYANQNAPDHLMRGDCPGGWNGPDTRDPDCPACRRMGPP